MKASQTGIAYLAAIRVLSATPVFPRRVFVVGLVLAAVWNVAFLRLSPSADDDVHRYVWDGRLLKTLQEIVVALEAAPIGKGGAGSAAS